MDITKREERNKDVIDLRKYYKKVFKCRCGRFYGSDIFDVSDLCPICIEKKAKNTQKKNKLKGGDGQWKAKRMKMNLTAESARNIMNMNRAF